MPALRDASELLETAVRATLDALDIDRDGKDAAMAVSALTLAREIDAAEPGKRRLVLQSLMPDLRAALESLGGSPAARAALSKGQPAAPGSVSKLDELRKARQKRA